MNALPKLTSSVGGKLILTIGIILLFTMLSVFIAIVAINKIDNSQRDLTQTSIPALVEVNHLYGTAIRIVKQTLSMIEINNIEELDNVMLMTRESVSELKHYVNVLNEYLRLSVTALDTDVFQ